MNKDRWEYELKARNHLIKHHCKMTRDDTCFFVLIILMDTRTLGDLIKNEIVSLSAATRPIILFYFLNKDGYVISLDVECIL